MLAGVLDLVLTVHAPFAHGRHDLQLRRQRGGRHVEADLVVALAGAAVSDALGALSARDLHQQGGDQGTAQGGRQRVLPLVDGARLQRRPHEVPQEGTLPSTTYAATAPTRSARRWMASRSFFSPRSMVRA